MMKYECDVCDETIDGSFISFNLDGDFLPDGDPTHAYEFHICSWKCLYDLSAQMTGVDTVTAEVQFNDEQEVNVQAHNDEGVGEPAKLVIKRNSGGSHGGIQIGHRDMDGYPQPNQDIQIGGVKRR